jgi:hypothetical protein
MLLTARQPQDENESANQLVWSGSLANWLIGSLTEVLHV